MTVTIPPAHQARIIWKNRTSIEDWIVVKAHARRPDGSFVYPYDLGCWANLKQVFAGGSDGIDWPVVDGCDAYTLTVRFNCI